MGFGKKHDFCKQKTGDKNRQSPSYHKQRTIVQPSVKRNEYRIALKKERLTHHQVPRSPQKRAKPNNFAQIEAAAEVVVPHIDVYPADAEPFAEPFSELMPRELRTSKGASAQYVPVITARRLQPNEVPHDDFGTVNYKPL